MAETDILPLDPDYPIIERPQSGVLRQAAASGKDLQRILRADQRVWDLEFASRSTDDIETLRAFCARLRSEHFLFNHKTYVNNAGVYLPRYFPVIFAQDPEMTLQMNEAWPAHLQLIEAPGRALGTLLFLNTSFDFWTAGAPNSWTVVIGAGLSQEIRGESGSALKMTGQGSETPALITQAANTIVKKGHSYRAAVRLKKSSGLTTASLGIDLSGTGVDTGGLILAAGSLTTDWAWYSADLADGGISIDIPADLVLRIHFYNTPTTGESIWVDRLLIVEGLAEMKNILPDPMNGNQTYFIEETAAVFSGTWTNLAGSIFHGLKEKYNGGTVTSDYALWTYAGYGFALWAALSTNRGIFEVYLDDVLVGEVDEYNSSELASARLFIKTDVPLGIHRVKLKATNRKNASATNFLIGADALEVIL